MIVAELFATLGLKPDEHQWHAGNELVEHLKTAVEALAVYEGFEHVVEMFNGVAESVEHAELAAKSLGTTSSAVQELGYATKLLGVSSEESEMALTHLARSVAEARKGSGPAAEAFAKLGVSMDDPAIKSGDTSKILDRVANAFAKLPDGATKTALSMDLFSRSGAKLIPLLDKGSAGLAKLRAEAHASGNVIDGEGAQSLHTYTEAMRGIEATATGLKNTLVVALAPSVVELAEDFRKWFDAHHDQAIAAVTAAAHGLGAALGFVADVVGDVDDLFTEAFAGDDGAQAILIGVAAIVATAVVPAFLAWAAATVVATWPILAIGAAVAAVSYGVIQLVKHWDAVKASIRSAWDTLKDTGEAVLDWIADLPVIKQLLELMHWIKHAANVGVGNALAESAAKGTSADFAHGQAEQDEQDRADAWQRAHGGSLEGMPSNLSIDQQVAFSRDVMPLDQISAEANAPEAYTMRPGAGGARGDTHINVGSPQITVNAPTGDAKDISAAVRAGIGDWWDTTLRDAHAATGGGDL